MNNEMIDDNYDADPIFVPYNGVRTDIHRPSAINPTEYVFVAFEHIPTGGDLGACLFIQAQRQIIQDHMKRTGGSYSRHEHGGNCMVCGSVNAIYTVLFYHELTNVYVRMGNDCAQKCDMAFSNGDFDAFKKRITDTRHAVAGKRKAETHLNDRGFGKAWELYLQWTTPCVCGQNEPVGQFTGCHCPSSQFQYEERTICSMVGKFVQYGDLSDKQFTFIGTLLEKINRRVEIAAQRAAEAEAAAPCPAGRITIEGVVLTVKIDEEARFGPTTKMLVRHDSGWKVWSTRPAGLNCERNDRISFVATVTVSDRDPKFGFAKRPTNGVVLVAANPVEAQVTQ